MSTPPLVLKIGLALILLAGLIGLAHLATAAETPATPPAPPAETVAPLPPAPVNPIVGVLPGTSETEYEQDPFEPTRVRSSTTKVKKVLLVRADGTLESRQVD